MQTSYIHVYMQICRATKLSMEAKQSPSFLRPTTAIRWAIRALLFISMPRLRYVCVAACCSVLQRVAACCSVLQCVAVCCSVLRFFWCPTAEIRWAIKEPSFISTPSLRYVCVAVCCSVLQRVGNKGAVI